MTIKLETGVGMLTAQRTAARYVIYGTVVWALATTGVRFLGQWVMTCAYCPMFGVLLLATAAVAWGLGRFLKREPREHRVLGAISFVLPEIALDIMTFVCFGAVYPNLGTDAIPLFGVWALFAYFTMLIAGLWSAKA